MSEMNSEELSLFQVDVLLNEPAQTVGTQLEAWNQTVRLYREWESVGRALDWDFRFMDRIARGEV